MSSKVPTPPPANSSGANAPMSPPPLPPINNSLLSPFPHHVHIEYEKVGEEKIMVDGQQINNLKSLELELSVDRDPTLSVVTLPDKFAFDGSMIIKMVQDREAEPIFTKLQFAKWLLAMAASHNTPERCAWLIRELGFDPETLTRI